MRDEAEPRFVAVWRVCRSLQAYRNRQHQRVKLWFAANGDKTFGFQYDLTLKSVVLDVGGFEGNWAGDIYAMHGSTIHVFEPVPAFAAAIRARFARNTQIYVWPFGLGVRDCELLISLAANGSSSHRISGGRTAHARVRSFVRLLTEQDIDCIDLMKSNIEGGEHRLLDHILDAGLPTQITDIQVQFYCFVTDAARRMQAIQLRLSQTHVPTYRYEFVEENWHLHAHNNCGCGSNEVSTFLW